MAPQLDPAILQALNLDAAITTLTAHGGSGFAFTGKITSVVEGEEKVFFVKIGRGFESGVMFAGIYSFLDLFLNSLFSLQRSCQNPQPG